MHKYCKISPFVSFIFFHFAFSDQMKRLEENKAELEKHIKVLNKQMKVDFLFISCHLVLIFCKEL